MLSLEQKFDIVAPLVIYHMADVVFKRAAQAAMKKLQKDEGLFAQMQRPAALGDVCEFDLYNSLFREIVKKNKPNWEEFRDKYGALGYRDENGEYMFTGDSSGFFPWYETADLIVKRLNLGCN